MATASPSRFRPPPDPSPPSPKPPPLEAPSPIVPPKPPDSSGLYFCQVYLLKLGFCSSSCVLGCASCCRGYIKVSWLLFLTCSPSPLVTSSIIPDLIFDGCVYNAYARSPTNVRLSDLYLSLSSWALAFLPTGKIRSYLLCCEQSFIIGVSQDSSGRSMSIGCSELCSTPVVNLPLSEEPKIHLLLPSLPLTTTNPGIYSHFHAMTESGEKQIDSGFINTLWFRYGNIGVESLLLATLPAFSPNLVKLFCCFAGVKMAGSPSSSSLAHHSHETLLQIASFHLSPLRPQSRNCSVSSPYLSPLNLQTISPLNLLFLDKFMTTFSRQSRERSSSTSSVQERISSPSLFVRSDFHSVSKTWIIDDAGICTSHSTTATLVASPLVAETLVMQNTMISAHSCGINSLSILLDAQILTNLMKSNGRHLEIVGLLNDIYLLLLLLSLCLCLGLIMLEQYCIKTKVNLFK
ncbi:hypothetical protein Rs2_39753 [Raphanus sativus]|nr:hypothetical protein Rs2_39753 [Raphanus sativus]